ncbi:glutamine-dependent NAD(+) synthetase with GAT domain-containing protein [Decorospora gaudefroyi]|uniref:Glutamine-dependent NAD(+) synthetase n=1 Tax=Decorospora gaudefroyi TaxID=184978 RepID=A0A6A5KGS7_9PLEO|nr:glutamine-dependent NAD(+) synthetase with GAT domain-containing protein [Decorospora gaudefroyi]
MGRLVKLATCSLNQWALDWSGNMERIKASIKIAKESGCKLRTGPELEVCGYGLLDHFLEQDTMRHAWEQLSLLLLDRTLDDIIIDVGMPVRQRGNLYNARVIILSGKILLIRPKMSLASGGNYREGRYFIPWNRPQQVEEYELLELSAEALSLQDSHVVPFGDGIISALDCAIGYETCEELFTPLSPHIALSLAGCDIIINSSGSHHELRKLDTRVDLIREATAKCGGAYLYANQQGCDGDRLYYDGCAMILVNGSIRTQGSQFSLKDVEVVTATVDLEEIWSFRTSPSRGLQSVSAPRFQRFRASLRLSCGEDGADFDPHTRPTAAQALRMHIPEEEIALGPACWLWDYLRRSGSVGFFLPLSGGIDSCATATLVYSMCLQVYKAVCEGEAQVIDDIRRIAGPYHKEGWLPESPQEVCNAILHTAFFGMSEQSSSETRSRAERLSTALGSYHLAVDIDEIYHSQKNLLAKATGFTPRFRAHGGQPAENLALQNIQARSRMVSSYYFAQMLPTARERPSGGSLLVLASGNVDECLRGYLTKYDCSSADINPIGSISKVDLKKFIGYAAEQFKFPILREFIEATPTAELEPLTEGYAQSDEADMGMTYAELSEFGRCRKERKLGPYGTWIRLAHEWSDEYTPREVAVKVKRFFHYYAINRHKMTTMTPVYHAEAYSPDDNRFDLRPFLYPPFFKNWSFKRIDEEVERLEKKDQDKADASAKKLMGDKA